MYARMTKFVGLAPERIDATVQEFEQNALGDLTDIPGFAGVTVLVDAGQGTAAALTFWESQDAMKESERTAAAAREQAITTGQAGPRRDAIVDHFEVVLHKLSE
jgi:heme-degrading monooxygenase HmoA